MICDRRCDSCICESFYKNSETSEVVYDYFYEKDIKEILTKEQYESDKYVISREKQQNLN